MSSFHPAERGEKIPFSFSSFLVLLPSPLLSFRSSPGSSPFSPSLVFALLAPRSSFLSVLSFYSSFIPTHSPLSLFCFSLRFIPHISPPSSFFILLLPFCSVPGSSPFLVLLLYPFHSSHFFSISFIPRSSFSLSIPFCFPAILSFFCLVSPLSVSLSLPLSQLNISFIR